ncbi:Xylulose kinase [Streptomyces californicus]
MARREPLRRGHRRRPDARGLDQAADLGAWAARRGAVAVAASPLSRARLTAAPAAAALGLDVDVLEGLREVGFGWGEGRTVEEMAAEDPEAVRRFREDADSGAFPGSEPVADAAAAAPPAALRDLARRHRGRHGASRRRAQHPAAHRACATCSAAPRPPGPARGFRLGAPRDEADAHRAALEGVAFVERLALERVGRLGVAVRGPLHAAGGGSRSSVWTAIRATVLDRPVHVAERAETAFGAALLAATGTLHENLAASAAAWRAVAT